MKKKILVTYQIPKEGLNELFDKYEVIYPKESCFSTEEIIKLIPDCDALLPVFSMKMDKEIIEKAKKLKIIANFGVGYDNIDIETATKNRITVTNTPDPVTEPTAELTLGLMLALFRRIAECDRKLRIETTHTWGVMQNLGQTLNNKTLGIVGLGKIGKAVARRAIASGMKIVYHNRKPIPSCVEREFKATYLPLEELLQTSDIVSLHLPLSEESHHIIGAEELKLMKKSSVLINTARGQICDEKALIEALINKEISGAALDVFDNEPYIPDDFFEMDNVVIVPHIGTATYETRIEMAQEASKNIINFFEGKIPPNIVNKEVFID